MQEREYKKKYREKKKQEKYEVKKQWHIIRSMKNSLIAN